VVSRHNHKEHLVQIKIACVGGVYYEVNYACCSDLSVVIRNMVC
jgi:hypothetical protein